MPESLVISKCMVEENEHFSPGKKEPLKEELYL